MPSATLPPAERASQGAPLARLESRLYPPDERIRTIKQLCVNGQTVGLLCQMEDATATLSDCLWLLDMQSGTLSMAYGAPADRQMVSLVADGQDFYWCQWREDQSGGWEILSLRTGTGEVETLRADPYDASTLAPTLGASEDRVYWYESDQPYAQQAPYQLQPVTLYGAGQGAEVEALGSFSLPVDWTGPCVVGGRLITGDFDTQAGSWCVRIYDLTGEEAPLRYPALSIPVDVQQAGPYVLWRQSPYDEDALGPNGALEEDGLPHSLAQSVQLGGSLMLLDLNTGQATEIDREVEQALLTESGVFYVNGAAELLCYAFSLGRVIRVLPAQDFSSALAFAHNSLWAVRLIDTGDAVYYRPVKIQTAPLLDGWPPLM